MTAQPSRRTQRTGGTRRGKRQRCSCTTAGRARSNQPSVGFSPSERDDWHLPDIQDLIDVFDALDRARCGKTCVVDEPDSPRRSCDWRLIGSADTPIRGATTREFRRGCRIARAMLRRLSKRFPYDDSAGRSLPRSRRTRTAEPVRYSLGRKVSRLLSDKSMHAVADRRPLPLGVNPTTGRTFISKSGDRESPALMCYEVFCELNRDDFLLRLACSRPRLWSAECHHVVLQASTSIQAARNEARAASQRARRLIAKLRESRRIRSGYYCIEAAPCRQVGQPAISIHLHIVLEAGENAPVERLLGRAWKRSAQPHQSSTVNLSEELRGEPADKDAVLNAIQYAAGSTSIKGVRIPKHMLGFFDPIYFVNTGWEARRAMQHRRNGRWTEDTFRLFLVICDTACEKRGFFGGWDGRTREGKLTGRTVGIRRRKRAEIPTCC